ncbi:hypothetical protein N9Q43_00025 [bacterium]|nr:hypothetical protein [bacterium]
MATWKKVVVSGSAISALNNDANYLQSGDTVAELTGSFTGSFAGDGSGLTGVVASSANTLNQGGGIQTFSYDGSASGVTVKVDSGSLAGNGLEAGAGLANLAVKAADTTIAVGAQGIQVVEANLSGIPTTALTANSIQIGTTDIELGATGSSVAGLTLTGVVATGSFSGDFTGTTNLPDLISGNGISGGPYDGAATATFAVQADGSTLTVGAGGVKVSDAGVTATQIASSVAGAGLSGGAGTALAVNVDDSSIEITTDSLNVKALGITNAMLAGAIATTKLTADDITLGTTNVTLGGTAAASIVGLTSLEAVSITGSFKGDGSEITGIASTLSTAGESGTGTVALKTQTLSILAGEGINTVASGQGITISGEDASAANKGVASFSDSNFTVTAGDVVLANDVAINQNLVVNNNLTVLGTASFQSTENLDVADRWIRMASGSNTVGDGGLAIQQTGPLDAEGFGYDSAVARWGITGSFDAAQSAIIPDAFMASVVEGAASDPTAVVAKYTKKGNIFVGANQDIYIYS